MTRKTIITASVLAALTALPTQAALMFNFDYSANTAGEGFLDASEGTARQAALDTAGNMFSNLFGSHFSDMGTLDIGVTSTDNSSSGTLASAGSNVVSACTSTGGCVVTEVVKTKLQTGVDANGAGLDGNVDVNWGWDWQLDPNTPANAGASEFDFFATIFHELTHALGFGSAIEQAGAGTAYFNDEWAAFDIFLQDVNGDKIIDDLFFIDDGLWDTASIGGTGNGLFFGGANAVAANGGNAVGIYSPTTWEPGSSGSHVDGVPLPTDMMKYDRDVGPETRTYSAVDVGILTDLGYTRISEPGTISLGLMGLICAWFVRRRKI